MIKKAVLIKELETTKQELEKTKQELEAIEKELADAKDRIDNLEYGDVDGTDTKYKDIDFLNQVLQHHFDTKITLVADKQWGGRIRTQKEIEDEGRVI